MTIKVLHVVVSMETGGLENGIVNLVNRHDTAHFKVDILCLSARGELADRIESTATEVFFDHATTGVPDSVAIVRRHLKKHRYDIVHSHGFSTMLASYLALLGDRNTVLINGEHGVIYADKLWQRLLQRFLFNRVHINLTVSAILGDFIADTFGVRRERFLPIINGVDTGHFCPAPALREELRSGMGLDGMFVVGSVGRLVPVKDYSTLIRAFALLVQHHDHCRLMLVGGGPEGQPLKALAQELGIADKVLFTGRRSDVAQLMNTFDVFALSSLTEGLSNTILEAMATGLPIVATRVGGNPEIVFEGRNGHLVSTGDAAAMAEVLEQLAIQPQALLQLSNNALEFTRLQCSLQNMVDNYEQAYRRFV